MSANQQTELKLIEMYDQDLTELFDNPPRGEGVALSKAQQKINIFEKSIVNYKHLFSNTQDIQVYEARLFFFKGMRKIFSGFLNPGVLSLSMRKEFYDAIKLFDNSLQIHEQPKPRNMKVFCYRQLGDKKNALHELNNLIMYYEDDDEVYLKARQEKDELEETEILETFTGWLSRSIFG